MKPFELLHSAASTAVALPAAEIPSLPVPAANELNLLELVLHASLPVQLVMVLLLLGSVASWVIIFRKKKVLDDARRAADEFEERFWSGADLAALFRDVTGRDRRRQQHDGRSRYRRRQCRSAVLDLTNGSDNDQKN